MLYNGCELFDAVLHFTDHFKNSNGLLSWKQKRENGRGMVAEGDYASSATDGDLDCVAALYMSSKRWNNQEYATRARKWDNAS